MQQRRTKISSSIEIASHSKGVHNQKNEVSRIAVWLLVGVTGSISYGGGASGLLLGD